MTDNEPIDCVFKWNILNFVISSWFWSIYFFISHWKGPDATALGHNSKLMRLINTFFFLCLCMGNLWLAFVWAMHRNHRIPYTRSINVHMGPENVLLNSPPREIDITRMGTSALCQSGACVCVIVTFYFHRFYVLWALFLFSVAEKSKRNCSMERRSSDAGNVKLEHHGWNSMTFRWQIHRTAAYISRWICRTKCPFELQSWQPSC